MKRILTVIGARPQFIKASVVSRAIKKYGCFNEIILHTGQHFDANMSDIFFEQLNIPRPAIQLDINGGSHGKMTGQMLQEIEKSLFDYKPDCVLVYGDTNSTLAGALAASKLQIPVAHVEAGLRSYNRNMPEEINRLLTDQLSSVLFCPTQVAANNLEAEGITRAAEVHMVGDVMFDTSLLFSDHAKEVPNIASSFGLATLHRAENTDDPERLSNIVSALNYIHNNLFEVVIPLHPRTRKLLAEYGIELTCKTIEPVSYLEMIWLLQRTECVLTDSGGLQKEAYFFSKPCVTLRDETEWVELVEAGGNTLVGADPEKIITAAQRYRNIPLSCNSYIYGDGHAAEKIVNQLRNYFA